MKGRDIYDLDQAAALPLDKTVLCKTVLYYSTTSIAPGKCLTVNRYST